MSKPRSSFEIFRNRNYRLYFTGQLISMVGTWMQSTVQAWLVYRISHSAAWLGIVTFCGQLPAFILSPLAGIVIDRYDRRKILIWVEIGAMVQAFLMAALIFRGDPKIAYIAALSIVLGLCTSFDITCRHALAYDLVGAEDLQTAISFNSVTVNGSRILGPALAGLLIKPLGEGWVFLLNGISYLAVIYGLIAMQMQNRVVAEETTSAGVLESLKQGLEYVRANSWILKLLAVTGFVSLMGYPYTVLLPIFAKEVLHGGADTLGWLIGASGLGAVVGIFTLATRSSTAVGKRIALFLVPLGVSFVVLAHSSHFVLSLIAMFFIGCFMMSAFPVINTAIQLAVKNEMRGRALSLYTMTFLGAMPLGSLLAGLFAEKIGARAVETGCGIACAGLGALILANYALKPKPLAANLG